MGQRFSVAGWFLLVLGVIAIGAVLRGRATTTPATSSEPTTPLTTVTLEGQLVTSNAPTTFLDGQLLRFDPTAGQQSATHMSDLPQPPVQVRWAPVGDLALVQIENLELGGRWFRDDLAVGAFSWWLARPTADPLPLPVGITKPIWNAESSKIAYVYVDPTNGKAAPRLTVAEPTGQNWVNILELTTETVSLSWSPDGLWFAVVVNGEQARTLSLVGVSSKRAREISLGDDQEPLAVTWRPDGQALLVVAAVAGAPGPLVAVMINEEKLLELPFSASLALTALYPERDGFLALASAADGSGTLVWYDWQAATATQLSGNLVLPDPEEQHRLMVVGNTAYLQRNVEITNIPFELPKPAK